MPNDETPDSQGESNPILKRVTGKKRGPKASVKKNPKSKIANSKTSELGSAGKYTTYENGQLKDDVEFRSKIRAIRMSSMEANQKTSGLLNDGGLGYADILDSQNIGMYSYEFPVDALELPSSRAEELRFYRLAYDRDPIVSSGIDLHTEIPLSKVVLEKPKCSVEDFADYVNDYFQRLVNDTKLFQTFIEATREYFILGEAFLYIKQPENDPEEPSKEAKKIIEKDKQGGAPVAPLLESEGASLSDNSESIMEWVQPGKRSSLLKKASHSIQEMKKVGISFVPGEDISLVKEEIQKLSNLLKLAAPGDPPLEAPPSEPDVDMPTDDGAPMGEEGMQDVDLPPMSGGGGGGGMPPMPDSEGGGSEVSQALQIGGDIKSQRELMEMKHYLKLLEKKEELLGKLKELKEERKEEVEIFEHLVNTEYEGFVNIQLIPPEQIEISNEGGLDEGPQIFYKPPENQKASYLESEDVDTEVKDLLTSEGKIPLNQDPFKGSYILHFARKKAGYELHGRSILQRCMRTIIYREKLRQVQSTLASRNMTPKTVVVAPGINLGELNALRAHIDEAKADPDYTVCLNYEMTWNEIGSEGRLLTLDGEYQHTNSDLAIGLGFSPEILIGEGLYGGNRIQLEIMNTRYLQFREVISDLIENQLFKPISMKMGFYETDKYGRPRWIYPKVSFSRMALRDSGDVYDMLFNMHSRGSIPVSIILEFLNIDPETCKRQLEDDLFTVNDSKMNEALSALYNTISQDLAKRTNVMKRVTEGLTLDEIDPDVNEIEGSGEGM
jgi:hypothetical protein